MVFHLNHDICFYQLKLHIPSDLLSKSLLQSCSSPFQVLPWILSISEMNKMSTCLSISFLLLPMQSLTCPVKPSFLQSKMEMKIPM